MSTLTPLAVAVPPMLEQACGYDGEAVWLSLYWEAAGDEAVCDDGRQACPCAWDAYLLFVGHRTVAPYLKGYELGSSGAPARHHLVVHRPTRALYVAPARQAQAHVRAQWPSLARLSREDVRAILGDFRRRVQEEGRESPAVRRAAATAQMAAHQRQMVEMAAWLNGQLRSLALVT